MISVLVCNENKMEIREIEELELLEIVGEDAEEMFPFSDRQIAMIAREEVDMDAEKWHFGEAYFYGTIVFVRCSPFDSKYQSLSEEQIEWLKKNVQPA